MELQAVVESSQGPQVAPETPARFLAGSSMHSSESSSNGTQASKMQFPNQCVEVSELTFCNGITVPPIVPALLWTAQKFLGELAAAFGQAHISETNKIQPVIRALLDSLVQVLGFSTLEVRTLSRGVSINSLHLLSGRRVPGIPDVTVTSKVVASPNFWGVVSDLRNRKLCKALLLGEVKCNCASVKEALQSQARWYLSGASECLGLRFVNKGAHFGPNRFAFVTDGFSWGFLRSSSAPVAGTAWNIDLFEATSDTERVALALVSILSELHSNSPDAATRGSEGDGSTRSDSSLQSSDVPGGSDEQKYPLHEDEEREDTSPAAGDGTGADVQGLKSKGLHRLSDISCVMTVCDGSPIIRGDGIPRGLDAKAFVEMSSAEKIDAFFDRGVGWGPSPKSKIFQFNKP